MGQFCWKLFQNPIHRGVLNLIKNSDEIASSTTLTPKSLYYKNREIMVAEIGDTYTGEKYQRQGMFSKLINQTRVDGNSMGIDFIYGTPNNQSLPGYQKNANFRVVEGLKVNNYLLPINIERKLKEKKVPLLFAKTLSFFYEVLIKLRMSFSRLEDDEKLILVESLDSYAEELDQFWNDNRAKFEFIFNRKSEILKWRFFETPNKYKFYIFKKSDKVAGYFVTRLVLDERSSRLVVADYLFLNGGDFGKSLKAAARQEMCSCDTIHGWCIENTLHDQAFKKLGFLNRGSQNIICHRNEQTHDYSINEHWHFTMADSDNI